MPPLHSLIKRLLLLGARRPAPALPEPAAPPACLEALIRACAAAHRGYNARAIFYGDRYRSAYWAVYLLSAVAVLFAVLPPALGWDQHAHSMHSYAGSWGIGELVVITCIGLLYWRGHHAGWQAQWLEARTYAELAWYLPLVAPLVDFDLPHPAANWYARVFEPGRHALQTSDIDALCGSQVDAARQVQAALWQDAAAMRAYGLWALALLRGQRYYHQRVRAEQHVLQHRVHRITGCLFALTAAGAALHLVWHTVWLSLVTVFFPALGASLHGALAQSEAYRLEQTSGRVIAKLEAAMEEVQAALAAGTIASATLAQAVRGAVAAILDEHHDWHGTVRPHGIPLA